MIIIFNDPTLTNPLMGTCYGRTNILPREYTSQPCAICLEPINQNHHNRDRYRNLTTPCCKQSIHQLCWEKSINAYGRCPFCNQNHVPEEFMKTIRFWVQYDLNKGISLNDALEHTCCFAKSPERDSQITNQCFLGDTVCFTDDMYWNQASE